MMILKKICIVKFFLCFIYFIFKAIGIVRDIVSGMREKTLCMGYPMKAVLLRYVQKNREKMAGTASQHKEMPDSMAVNNFFIKGVENNSNGIEQSSGNQQGHARTRKSPGERANSHHCDPAHEQVNCHRKNAPAFRKQECLEEYRSRQAPRPRRTETIPRLRAT